MTYATFLFFAEQNKDDLLFFKHRLTFSVDSKWKRVKLYEVLAVNFDQYNDPHDLY